MKLREYEKRLRFYNTEDLSYWDMYRGLPEETRYWIRTHLRGQNRWDKEAEIEEHYLSFYGETKRPWDQHDETEVQTFLRRFRDGKQN